MKIVFLIKEIHPNSGQTYNIAEIIKYLLSSHPDWSISVFTNKIYRPIVEGMNNSKVRLVEVNQYYSSILFKKRLASELKKYDILYVKGCYPYVFPAKNSGRPTVLVVHQIDSPKLFNGMVPKLKVIAANLLTKHVLKKVNIVVTVSDELGLFYETKFGLKVNVIPDQISDLFFLSPERNEPNSSRKIRLLTVGNWDGPNGRKRHDTLLKYFAGVIKTLPSLHLSMVGLSNDNIKELNKVCNYLQLSNYVTLKGNLVEKDLIEEFVNSHIYVTATTYEGFYRQIVESFATGMPAIVYDSRQIINDPSSCASVNHVLKSGAGELFYDSESFKAAIIKTLDNYSKYSSKASIYAKLYSSEAVGRKTETLLEDMLYKQKI